MEKLIVRCVYVPARAVVFTAFLVGGLVLAAPTDAVAGPKVVFVIGEREYETEVTLPAFAATELTPRGYDCVFVYANGNEGPARNEFPGIEAVDEADILVVSTRRRALPTADLERVRKHFRDGKAFVAIRTACHGFALRNEEPPAGHDVWKNFDTEILGARYDNHLKEDASTYTPTDAGHPVLKGVSTGPIKSDGSLYRMFELSDDATVVLNGAGVEKGEDVTYPAAWVRTTSAGSRVFGSTIGHKSDFERPAIRKLLVNAFAWCADDPKLAALPTGAALAAQYGFDPVEVYELDWRTFGLQKGHFNGDELTDVVAVDNRKSRLALFVQRDEMAEPEQSSRTNAIVSLGRFEEKSILVDRSVTALSIGDVNGDGRDDLVTLEKPERLTIRHQTEDGFVVARTLRITDAGEGPFDLASNDLDGDGDVDIVVLAGAKTVLFESLGQQGLASGRPVLNTSNQLSMLQLTDIDGDGRADWFYNAKDAAGSYLCVRLQDDTPLSFGPELRLAEDSYRAMALGEADGRPGAEIFAIDAKTGRIEALGFDVEQSGETSFLSDRVTQYGLTGGKQDRTAVAADFNGDGRLDLAVSNPEAAEVALFLQDDSGLANAILCPSLLGISFLDAADFDGDGRAELAIISDDESSLGIASWDEERNRLGFPKIVPVADGAKPIAMTIPEVVAEEKRGFVVIADISRGNLRIETWSYADGQWNVERQTKFSGGSVDEGLRHFDANRDGQTDFLAIRRREQPVLLTSSLDGELTIASGGLSLPKVEAKQVSMGTDGQSILLSQNKFVRRMSLDDAGNWQVAAQFNAPTSQANFESAVEIRSASGDSAVAAYDLRGGKVTVFAGEETPVSIDVGQFSLQQMISGKFDSDAGDDVVLIGGDRVGLVRSSGAGPTLKTRLTYETDDEKAYFADVLTGDVNADGIVDLIVNETRQHTVAVVALREAATAAEQAIRFKLFEEKSFSSSRDQPGLQPREMLLADINGDGREDLLLLCHDRLLIHPQDAPDGK